MDRQTVVMLIKPVLAALGTLLGTFGVTGILGNDAQINAASVLIGAIVVATSGIWAIWHSKAITAKANRIAATAYAAGSAEGVQPTTAEAVDAKTRGAAIVAHTK